MDAARFANFPAPRVLAIGELSSRIRYTVCEELPGEQLDQQFQWEEFGFKLSHFHSHATKSVFPDESFTLPERKIVLRLLEKLVLNILNLRHRLMSS